MSASDPLAAGLYIVATPIGNLSDITARAVETLREAELILVEDTRVTGKLLNRLGIATRMQVYNDHSDNAARDAALDRAATGPVALVSDAGTPLISDPGYKLVRAARERGIAVTTIPGPSAAIAALTLSGLPSDRFLFAGFLPAKAMAREAALRELAPIDATLVLFENAARLAPMLAQAAAMLGRREAAVVREITKRFEECVVAPLDELAERYADTRPKGEIVVIIGPPAPAEPDEAQIETALRHALTRLSPSQAAAEVARATGSDRRALYARALELKR